MNSNEWRRVKLENSVVEIIDGDRGINYPKQDEFFEREYCLFLNAGNVTNDGFKFEKTQFISKEKDELLRKGKLKRNDIVLTTRGTVGNVAYYDNSIPFDNVRINSGMVILRLDNEQQDIYTLYLYQYLKSSLFSKSILSHSSGSAQPQLPIRDLKQIELLLPPFDTQRYIADILTALDDKIKLNRQTNAILETITKATFKEWFIDNENTEDWQESSLEDIFGKKSDCVLTGPFGSHLHAHDYRDEGTPLILVKHVMDGHILEDGMPLVGAHKLSEMQRYTLEVGDIVFTRVGAVGRSAYVHPRNKGWLISGQTLRVRVPDKSKLNPRFLAQIYLEQSFVSMVNQHAVGTTRPSLNTSILLSFKFLLPPIKLQNKFSDFVSAIDEQVQHNLDENRTLESLRDTLLPKLMSGEIEIDEVARNVEL